MPTKRGRSEEIRERRRLVWRLRKMGYSQREIVEALAKMDPPYRVSLYTVNRDLKAVLEELKRATEAEADQWRILTTARLEDILKAHWQKALERDERSTSAVLRILAELRDLWIPKSVAIAGTEPIVVEFIRDDQKTHQALRDST